jgi:hypothetical protein
LPERSQVIVDNDLQGTWPTYIRKGGLVFPAEDDHPLVVTHMHVQLLAMLFNSHVQMKKSSPIDFVEITG